MSLTLFIPRPGCTSGDLFSFQCPETESAHEHNRYPDPEGDIYTGSFTVTLAITYFLSPLTTLLQIAPSSISASLAMLGSRAVAPAWCLTQRLSLVRSRAQ